MEFSNNSQRNLSTISIAFGHTLAWCARVRWDARLRARPPLLRLRRGRASHGNLLCRIWTTGGPPLPRWISSLCVYMHVLSSKIMARFCGRGKLVLQQVQALMGLYIEVH